MLTPIGRQFAKHPIQLSIVGDGRVVRLTPWTIRNFMQQFATSNPGSKYLASLFAFRWMKESGKDKSAWERLKQGEDLSNLEVARIEKQANYFLVRDKLTLSPRPKEIISGYVSSNGRMGSRRTSLLPFNGLALELRDISKTELLDRQTETIVVTADDVHGSFKLLRLHGLKTVGNISYRRLVCVFSSFYDRAMEYEYSLSEFHKSRWYQVVELGALDGFTIIGSGNASEQRYTTNLVRERARESRRPKSRQHKQLLPRSTSPVSNYTSAVARQTDTALQSPPHSISEAIQTLTTLRIWELVSSGQEIEPYFQGLPTNCIEWAREVKLNLLSEFQAIESQILKHMEQMPQGADLQEAIHYFRQSSFPVIALMVFREMPYAQAIWRFLRPKNEKFFPET